MPSRGRRCRLGGELEGVEGDAGVAAHDAGQRRQRLVRDLDAQRAEAALLVGERGAQDALDLLRRERLELEDAGAGEQRRDDLERRVLGRGADERDRAVLDIRQDDVLLRLVEAVDLVDEEDRALPLLAEPLACFSDDAAEVSDAGRDGGDGLEVGLRERGDDAGEGGLAGAGRAPEDHRGELVGVDGAAQDAPLADEVLLADELVEGARPHARGERGVSAARVRAASAKRFRGLRRPAREGVFRGITLRLSHFGAGACCSHWIG